MDLRAFIHTPVFVFLLSFWGNQNAFAFPSKNDNSLVPYEIKFADITFQLNDVTRYLIQIELKNIQSNRQNMQSQLDKTALFLPIVEPILKEQNVPNDFKYLVSYNTFQSSIETSTSLESGIYWCLDKQKAEDVDLLMTNQLDERKHLIAATKGASLCLKRNYVLYKNWGTTLFSHISDKKVLNLLEVNRKWSSNAYILLDSPAYSAILQFLAYKIAIEREYPAYKPSVQKIIYEYPYSKGKTLNRVSAELKVEPATLNEFNLWLNAKNVPDTDCQVLVVVPASRYSEVRVLAELSRKTGLPAKDLGFPVLKREEIIAKSKGMNKGGIFFTINDLKGVQAEMCDVVVTMAYKADISIEKFVDYNDMKVTDLLHIGQVYYIEKKNEKARVPFHVVREGETLWDISQIYGIKLENILDYNRLASVQRLQRGRIVWLQTTRPKNKPIEYVEMPDEFAVIEEMLSAEKEGILPPVQVKDSVKTIEPSQSIVNNITNVPKENNINSSRLSQETANSKSENSDVSMSKNDIIKENNIIPSPLRQENINSKSENSDVSMSEKEIPKENNINTSPLSQEIKKGQSKDLNLVRSIDNDAFALNVEDESNVVLKGEKVKTDSNETFSEQVTSSEQNKSESKYVYYTVSYVYHTVSRDENLFRISVNYNVSVERLWMLNNLSSTIVKVGTVLKVKSL